MVCKFFLRVFSFIEVVMQCIKKHFLSALVLSVLGLSTAVSALENIDCIDYSGDPDGRCQYYRIMDNRGARLWVVPPGEDPRDRSIAVPYAEFYVYAPQEEQLNREAFRFELMSNSTEIHNLSAVQADSVGFVTIRIGSDYELQNFVLGTSDDAVASDPVVSIVYNFYVPYLKYYVEGKEVTKKSILSYEVGDTMHVNVEALIPFGPNKDRLDSALDRDFYFSTEGASKDLVFLSAGGENLKQANGSVVIRLKGGKGEFLVVATKAIDDGSKFSLSSFDDPLQPKQFILNEEFPGEYQFTNPDMPTLDLAAIYDTDGDGVGDSIAAWFGGNLDSVDVKDFLYSWPSEKSYKEYSGKVKQKKNVYGLPDVDVKLQTESAEGGLKAYVCSSVGDRCDTLKTALVDSIGAAIQSATLLKGSGATDTLIVRFNKVMDPTWKSGRGLKLNGKSIDVSAISKDGTQWTFTVEKGVVQVGDMLKIETVCSDKDCPSGILTAADGVPTSRNNQEVPVQNAGRVYVDSDKNGFYDRNGDGRMDSASVGFETPITESDLKEMDLTFYWLDSDGELVAIKPNLKDLTISDNGHLLGFALDPEKYDIKKMLTAIDSSYSKDGSVEYGYATIGNKVTVDGKDTVEETKYGMHDYMPPVISSTFLNPESFQMMEPDKFKVTFSEAIDYTKVNLSDDCLAFYVDGAWVHFSLSSAEWEDDGKSVTLYMEAGEDLSNRMNPADSVRFDNFTNGLVDLEGNNVSEISPAVMVEGDPRVIMKTTSFADLNKAEEFWERDEERCKMDGKCSSKSFGIMRVKDAEAATDQSSLGVLMDIGFSTIMKEDSLGASVPDMKDIGLHWELYVYTNLGGYVGGASESIACDDSFFDGNCLENPDKLYVRWKMRADNGRRVGVGIYLAKFKIKVYGAKEDFTVERIFRWGITAKKR